MLSEEEQRELKALAKSNQIREEFELIRRASWRTPDVRQLDAYLSFVTCLHRLQTSQPLPRPFPIYTNIRL